MKSIARLTSCIAFVFFLATSVSAQTIKPAVSSEVLNDLLRQILVASKAAAPYPESWDEIKIDGPADDYIDVELVPLSPRKITYLITGKQVPFYGAREPIIWIYEQTDGNMRLLADLGASGHAQVSGKSTKGYRDIVTTGLSGNEVCTMTYKFDGRRYREQMNSFRCRPF